MAIKPIAYWVRYYNGTTNEQMKYKAFADFMAKVQGYLYG